MIKMECSAILGQKLTEKNTFYVNDFKKWALEQYNEYRRKSEHIQANVDITSYKCACIDFRRQKVAFSKCHPHDQFDPIIGIGIAYAKLMEREIPQEAKMTPISQLSAGDNFIYRNAEYTVIGQSAQFKGDYVCEKKNTNILEYFYIKEQVRKIQ